VSADKIVTCAATLLRASYGEPAELDDATADEWRRIAYEARVQGDALRADLAQASTLLRASEARHEREHAADVEALRALEATCTGLRGELDAKRAEYAESIFRYEMRVAKAERERNEARAKEDWAWTQKRLATELNDGLMSSGNRIAANLARVTAERDEAAREVLRVRNVVVVGAGHIDAAHVALGSAPGEHIADSVARVMRALAAADALADACRDSGTGQCRCCHSANTHHAKCPVALYNAARGGK